jgi:predicted DNA-binding protein (MmcQ/YjbR family)
MELEKLRTYCLSLPAVTEDIKWESHLVFSVGNKMFCLADLDEPHRRSFKVPEEGFEELCNRPGFSAAPHLARAKWVSVSGPSVLSRKEWEQFILESYRLVRDRLPKKLKKELGLTA